MSFNPDKNKQAQEVVFSRKQSKPKYPQLLFNKTPLLILPTKSTLILDDFRWKTKLCELYQVKDTENRY